MDMSIRFPWPGLYFEYIPKTVRIFGTDITLYGLLIGAAILLASFFIVLEARRRHHNTNHYLAASIMAVVFGIAGARLLYVACFLDLYQTDTARIFMLREGGLAFYGALGGGILGAALACVILRESFGAMADVMSLGLLMGQVIGRWGDFFNRSSFGEYTDLPVAMQLPLSAVHSSEVTGLMREHLVTFGDSVYIQVHPAFIYESIWCLILLIFLMVRQRRKLFEGEILLRYMMWYSLGRFGIEWLRTDKLYIEGLEFGINQVISAALFVFALVILLVRRSMAKKRISYKRQRQEMKYASEEKAAAEEDSRSRVREYTGELTGEGEHTAPALPEDVRQALADLEEETRRLKEYSDRRSILPEEAQDGSLEKQPAEEMPDKLPGEAEEDVPGEPGETSGEPGGTSGEPEKASGGPGETSDEPEKASGEPGETSDEPEKASGGPEETSEEPEKISGEAGKVPDEYEKASDGPEQGAGGSEAAAVPQESFSISDLLAGRRSGIPEKEDVL